MKVNLTETGISRAAKEARETGTRLELTDARHPGLRLRIAPSKQSEKPLIVWTLNIRDRLGAMRRFPVGKYPDMGVAAARDAATSLALKVKNEGADPIADARRDRAMGRDARAGIGTLRAELDDYEAARGSKLKSWPHSRLRVERVFKPLLDKPAATLTANDFQHLADTYPAQQSASFAVRTVRPALRWLAKRGRLPAECATITQPEAVKSRERALSREELGRLLPVLEASKKPHARMMLFLLLTALRLNEAGRATWGDIDWTAKTLTVPVTKNKRVHTVALSRQAVALLQEMKPKDVKSEALIFATSEGRAIGNWDREGKAIQAASRTAGWHRHDLRRTAATLCGELGIPPHVIESVLNHQTVSSRLASTYNRSRYAQEAADALQLLADDLDLILSKAKAAAENTTKAAA